MGASSSKPAPTGGRTSGGSTGASEKPKAEPLVQRKFDRCSAAHKTDPGFGADEDDNQDSYLITDLKKDEVSLYALFDGHGHQGKAVAELVKDCTVEILGKHLSNDKTQEGITAAFAALDEKVAGSGEDIAEAGCSATLIVYDRSKKSLLISNAGDTKAVLGTGSGASFPARPSLARASGPTLHCIKHTLIHHTTRPLHLPAPAHHPTRAPDRSDHSRRCPGR